MHRAAPGQARVFRMLHHGNSGAPCGPERAQHHIVGENRLAIIGYRNCPGDGVRAAKSVSSLTQAAEGSRGDGKNVCARRARRVPHPEGPFGGIVDRVRVGHGANRGESAGDGGAGAGMNVLFVFLARRPEVHVNVDQPRGRRSSHERP